MDFIKVPTLLERGTLLFIETVKQICICSLSGLLNSKIFQLKILSAIKFLGSWKTHKNHPKRNRTCETLVPQSNLFLNQPILLTVGYSQGINRLCTLRGLMVRIKGNNPNCNLFFACRDFKNIVIIIFNQSNMLTMMILFWNHF